MKNKGITLAILIITIIILLLLAGVGIAMITGEDGLLAKVNSAAGKYNETAKNEARKLDDLIDLITNDIKDLTINVENEDIYYIGKTVEFNCPIGIKSAKLNDKDITSGTTINEVGTYTLSLIDNEWNKSEVKFYVNDGLLALIKDKELEHGIQTINIKDVTYNIDLIIVNDDLLLDGTTTNSISNLITSTKTYEVGKTEDVATSTKNAQNMVILKVNGNLTINKGVTLTAIKSSSGFGGPKGMYVCVNGTINNNGTISMTARGAKAEGQDVYLWQNSNGDYEYIPAIGGEPGKNTELQMAKNYMQKYNLYNKVITGIAGANITSGRALAGGGSGYFYIEGANSGNIRGYVGNGARATSYSGGSGGGAILYIYNSTSSTYTYYGDSGKENGGAGGNGNAYDGVASWYRYAGGGAGNPGGKGYYESTPRSELNGSNGTGGLLIIFGKNFINNGKILSEGSKSNFITVSGQSSLGRGGGSGGGSINIFYKDNIKKGTISASGGAAGNGGNGGTGSINIGRIVNGTYVGDN